MSAPVPPELTVVADTIAAERQIFEYLLFRLVEARLVLSADETRFIAQATREVEDVVSALRSSERRRSIAIDQLAIRLGVPSDEVTLSFLLTNSPEPYSTIFRRHREAISELAVEIEQLTVENRRLATVAARNVSDALDAIIGSAPVVFTMLDGVIADLKAGERSGLGASIDSVRGALDRVLVGRGVLGAAANRIELAEFRARADELDMKTQLSSVEEADMAEAIMELQIQEVSYQAAQSALAKSIQPSLTQFLR